MRAPEQSRDGRGRGERGRGEKGSRVRRRNPHVFINFAETTGGTGAADSARHREPSLLPRLWEN